MWPKKYESRDSPDSVTTKYMDNLMNMVGRHARGISRAAAIWVEQADTGAEPGVEGLSTTSNGSVKTEFQLCMEVWERKCLQVW